MSEMSDSEIDPHTVRFKALSKTVSLLFGM